MKHKLLVVSFSFTLLSFGANSQTNLTDTAAINKGSLGKEISVLASDAFQGRKPFTAGETKTINYLQDEFKSLGLEPGNGSSYFQNVPMVNIVSKAAPTMQVQTPKGTITLKGFDDYVISTERDDKTQITLDKNELVFAGYGVVAPEYNWNDYAGLDVKGKIVMVMVNDPGFGVDTTLFKGDTMTYYGRWTYKFEEAARQGAKGCLIVHNTKAASYPFSVLQNNWNTASLHLDTRGKNAKYCDVTGWITGDAAMKLLQAAGLDSSIFVKANQKGFTAVPLNEQLSTSMQVNATYNQSHNVIAKITGSKYPDEYIIYTGHWDHLGIGTPDDSGDSIYNGASDNASGSAGLLEIARAFKTLQPKPERTVVFLAVTAEEQGLWGSAYYAQNPVYPLTKTVADLNMDMLNSIGKTADIVVTGAGQNELEDVLKQAAQQQGRYISFENHPEAGHYYRSDHFSFAKVGVPAMDAGSGTDVIGKGKAHGQQAQEEFTRLHYHRPSDEYSENMQLDGAVADLKLLFDVGKQLAFSHTWPQWKTGSEFKALRDKSASMRQ